VELTGLTIRKTDSNDIVDHIINKPEDHHELSSKLISSGGTAGHSFSQKQIQKNYTTVISFLCSCCYFDWYDGIYKGKLTNTCDEKCVRGAKMLT